MQPTILYTRESMIPDVQKLKQVLYTSGAYDKFNGFFIETCAKEFNVPQSNITLDINKLELHIVYHNLIDRDKAMENMRNVFRVFIDNVWVNGIDVDRYINTYDMLYDIILFSENDIIIRL